MLAIRTTVREDLASVVAIETSTDTADWLGETGLAWHQRALADADQDHLVAEQDGALAGYAVLAGVRSDDRVIELRRMALTPTSRGHGQGRMMLRATIARSYEHHAASRLWLDVKTNNHRARALYESEGFVQTRLLTDAVTELDGSMSDLVVMVHTPPAG